MATEIQILANQQNAQLSTGPKNTLKTSKNAQKYGVFSKELIINCKYYKENPEEFEMLKEEFYQEYEPKTITERFFVGMLIETTWKLRRVNKARDAMAIEQMESAEFNANRRVDDAQEVRYALTYEDLEEGWKYRGNEQINKNLIETIDKIDALESDEMTEEEVNKELSICPIIAGMKTDGIENMPINEKKRVLSEALCKVYDIQEKPLKDIKKKKIFMKKLEIAKCLVIPDITNQNLSTYENTLEKRFYRALVMLRQIKKGTL